MADDPDSISSSLLSRLNREAPQPAPPFLYLDPEAVLYLFQELSGMSRSPSVKRPPGRGALIAEPGDPEASPPPTHILFESMADRLKAAVPRAETEADFNRAVFNWAWVAGLFQPTRFPDGGRNWEILIGDFRGLLFLTPDYFNSLARPLIADDRVHGLTARVEALVQVQGAPSGMIFYHHTYGDDREHRWAPLAPVAVRILGGGENEADGSWPF